MWLDQVKKNGMELEISWKSFILDANKDGVDQELFWESSTDQQGRSMYAHKISKAALQQGRELFSRLNLNIYISRHSGKRIRLDKYDELLAVAVHSGLNKEKLLLDLEDPNLIKKLSDKGVSISASPIEEKMPSLFGILLSWFPMLLLIAVWIFFMRQMQGGKGGAMGFGKSKAKMMNELKGKVTFNDVAGVEEAKEEVEEVVEFLKDPKKFSRLGGKIPRGCLLVGPPGTGKTLLARAIAGEAAVPFFTISGSDFVEMFVGVGASRVRDMFEQGKKHSPCIIFIDEIDAVG